MNEITYPIVAAHKHSANHREEILASSVCGCFYCLATFPPSAVVEWVHNDRTALCPKCGIDSVVGDKSGFRVADKSFLDGMQRQWFG